jgi:hypothetical protein
MHFIAPAMSPKEREALLAGIKANAPAPFYQQLLSVIEA